jgi:hypothetical protein
LARSIFLLLWQSCRRFCGDIHSVIRPFRPGDLYLIQRLNRQATKFHTVQTLLHPHSVLQAAFGAAIPWGGGRVATYVLRQDGHGLVNSGFLQVQKRAARPEADVLCLSPGLDAPAGHPATWQKLLSAYLHDVTAQGVLRIYADVLDQPLPVNTFAGVGFHAYSRQTIWRLFTPTVESYSHLVTASIRPQVAADEWALSQLYAHCTPAAVQVAEGWPGPAGEGAPLLHNWLAVHGLTFVLAQGLNIAGALQIASGSNGSWLQWWTDTRQPEAATVQQLLCFGLSFIRNNGWRTPVYLAVADYQGGLAPLLSDYGFAPFTDRVKMVKHMAKWVRESAPAAVTVLEPASEIVPTTFAPPASAQQPRPARIRNPS